MASSTVTGDRRLASTRRGGMTVLGKVAVPKPINLPSQRLENHGLDPNVEIVPKGTLSWGSRPSSAGSNAWGTSALSPTTDGTSSSPSHLLGRPSSGGGTRPSTAGSERAHDSNVNVWGSNSRPSSASGVLASNHASAASSRPRSADNRPGSSHLSRFAEPAPEGSGVWGATGAAERMGVASSAKEGFSLSTGDFPTLGSEKDESKMNMEPLDHASHGRPGSSGGVRTMADSRGIAHGDDVFRNSDVKGNSWRKDGPPFVEDGPRPSMERWYGEPHLHPNPNMAPPHYESWRGAQPVNPPGGVWYRGPPGPPYGGPVPPGGFPMEPYPYYHPQVPAPGLGSSQPLPPGAGHHGHHPNNGDRPHMPHVPHLHPGMPMRPGFYPGPVPYDGYYRPPMGFCNPNERDLPFMGMPVGPPVYSRHANQNAPDLNNPHPRSREGRGSEQVEPGPPHDPRGHYKVLVNPNDGWNPNDEEKWGHRVTNSALVREKGILSRTPLQENSWEDDYKKNEDIHYGKSTSIEVSSHSSDKKFASNIHSNMKFPERLSNIDEAQMSPAMDDVAPPQDHSLIQKIEGLNAKARATGEKQEGFHIEDSNDRVQMVDAKNHRYVNEANSDVVLERHFPTGVLVPVSRYNDVSAADKSQESAIASVTAAPRRSVRGAQSRGNPHAKGRFSGQEAEGWGMKSDSQSVLEASSRFTNNDQVEEHNAAAQTAEVSRTNVQGKDDGESVVSSIDASDMQRAKMREIAKQRAIQLQKEEEERVREQKAKALAKLEELNRRSANQGVENPNQKETSAPPGHVSKKQDLSGNQPEPSVDADHSTGSSSAASNNIAQNNVKSASKSLDSAVSSRHLVAELKRSDDQEDSFSSRNALPTADTNVDDAVSHRTAPQVREVKQKRGYKQRQNVPLEKNPVQDAIPSGRTDMLKDLKVASSAQEVTANIVDSGVRKEQAESPVTAADIPVQRKRVNKSGKNRHKVEELSMGVSLSVTQLQDSDLAQANPESGEQNGSSLHVNSISMQLSVDPKDAIQSSENHSSLLREDTHARVNNASKAQHSRKPKSSQSNRLSEKTQSNDAVVWAPVRLHNKLEATDQPSQKAAEPLVSPVAGDNLVQNSSRTKRAEMERYVPKPVAKELAQQVSIQQPLSPSIVPAEIDGSGGREKASHGSEKAGASMDLKHVDSKNRHQRAQGSWRQRFSAESSIASSQDSSAYTSKNIQTSNGSHSTVKSDESFVRGKPSRPDELSEKGPQTSISDGWECANDSSSNSLAAATGLKDQIPAGRGKRHPYKGQKGSGNSQNFDHKDSNVGLTDLQCSHVDSNRMEKTVSSKENRAAGDRSGSHWQPKSQGYVAVNQQGNRSRGSQNTIAEDSKALKSETGPNTGLHPSSQRNQSAAKSPVLAPENKGAVEAKSSMGYQEAKRDKRVASVKGRPHLPSQVPEASVGDFELDSFGAMDGHNEQRPFSGNRKSSNYSGRFNRGHEPRGDWSSGAQENKQHYLSANRERQRQNLHYEYQPVGPHNGSSRSNESGVPTESQSGASRFRERGQSNSRRGRGNFHGRQSGNED